MIGFNNVIFHELATRQFDSDAPYTTWTCENDAIIRRVVGMLNLGMYESGDAPDSYKVKINHKDIYTPVVTLREGQELTGVYQPRLKGDIAIKMVNAVREEGQEKMPAKSCEAIVFLIDGIYNIVTVNGSPTEGATPVNPLTLLRTYFRMGAEQAHGLDLTWEEMEVRVLESLDYWKDKAMIK